jgi:hypothetical protein
VTGTLIKKTGWISRFSASHGTIQGSRGRIDLAMLDGTNPGRKPQGCVHGRIHAVDTPLHGWLYSLPGLRVVKKGGAENDQREKISCIS